MSASADAHRSGQRVLVTGGAGFIGSHLVERLTAQGDHVTVIDDLSTGSKRNLAAVDSKRMRLIEAPLSAAIGTIERERFDVIYHLAAAVGVRLVIEQPVHTIETNVQETSAVLELAASSDCPVLIASTSEVYGKSTRTPFHEDDDVVYGPTIYARWSYACSKAIDEHLALAYHRQRGLPVRIVRFFNTVGPRQVGRYGMVLPRFVEAALRGEALSVYGDGQQTRCFCDVRDVVRALPALMAAPETAGQVFNLGTDEPMGIAALAELVRSTLGSDSPIRFISYEAAYGEAFDDLRHRQPDLARIRQAIGFEPRVPLVQTIRDLASELKSRDAVGGEARSEPTQEAVAE